MPSTAFIILAAGPSSRMGKPKQLVEYNGSTLIHHAIEIALETRKIISSSKVEAISAINIVLGSDADDIRYEIASTFNRKERKALTILINHDWREGISSSIRCGVAALSHETDAALFLLCDQPLITAEHLHAILNSSIHPKADQTQPDNRDALIVASAYSGIMGVPALFKKALFPELLKLTGDEGARRILRAHEKETLAIPFPDAAFDLDEPGQL